MVELKTKNNHLIYKSRKGRNWVFEKVGEKSLKPKRDDQGKEAPLTVYIDLCLEGYMII